MSPSSSMRGRLMVALVYLTAAACANGGTGGSAGTAPRESPEPAEPSAAPASAPLVVFLGDSLTAGYGLPQDESFPAILEREMAAAGRPIRVVNAGVSGDTTTGALDRLSWLLAQKPDVLVVGLGANDAFRGQPVAALEGNLRTIVRRAEAAGVRVLILGMRVPPNYGPGYADDFAAAYARVARETRATLVPFLLDGVGGDPGLNLDDGIHPNAEGQRRVAANVLPYLEGILEKK